MSFPCSSAGKESVCNVGGLGSILVWEDPLEKGTATYSSILAWRIPWTVQSMELQRVGHHWATFTFHFQHNGIPLLLSLCSCHSHPTEYSFQSLSLEVYDIPSTSFQTPTTIMISSPIYIRNSTFLCVCLRLHIFWSNWFLSPYFI